MHEISERARKNSVFWLAKTASQSRTFSFDADRGCERSINFVAYNKFCNSVVRTSEVFIKRVETLAVSLSVRCFFGDSSAPASTYSPSEWARSQQWLTTKALSKFFNFSNYTNMVDIWTLKHRWNLFLFDYSLGLFTEFFGNFEYSKSYAGSKFFTSMLL